MKKTLLAKVLVIVVRELELSHALVLHRAYQMRLRLALVAPHSHTSELLKVQLAEVAAPFFSGFIRVVVVLQDCFHLFIQLNLARGRQDRAPSVRGSNFSHVCESRGVVLIGKLQFSGVEDPGQALEDLFFWSTEVLQ